MCGRFVLYAPPSEVRRTFGYADAVDFPPRYNIAPTQPIAIVRTVAGVRRFDLARWGLVPRWVDDPRRFELLINARAETLAERPAFRDAIRYRRCLIPSSGYYDWQGGGMPRFFRPVGVVGFAGLYETWSDRQFGGDFDSACIITVAAGAGGHAARMPAVIAPEDFPAWLGADDRDAASRLDARPGLFEMIPVSRRVNHAGNDDPTLIEPAAPSSAEVPFG